MHLVAAFAVHHLVDTVAAGSDWCAPGAAWTLPREGENAVRWDHLHRRLLHHRSRHSYQNRTRDRTWEISVFAGENCLVAVVACDQLVAKTALLQNHRRQNRQAAANANELYLKIAGEHAAAEQVFPDRLLAVDCGAEMETCRYCDLVTGNLLHNHHPKTDRICQTRATASCPQVWTVVLVPLKTSSLCHRIPLDHHHRHRCRLTRESASEHPWLVALYF